MSNVKLVAVDSGKYATKAIVKLADGKTKKLMFRTKMDKTEEVFTTLRETYAIKVGNHPRYLIGEGAEGVDYEKSKAKDIHKFAIYTAISRLVDNGDHVNLAIGCPLTVFNNVNERAAYKDFIMGDKEIHMVVNGEDFEFTIDSLVVCPESSGIIWTNVKEYERKLIGIIDIGGLNTNACVYEKMNPIKSTSFTNNLGANILRNELKLALNERFVECNLQDWQMEDIIENGFIKSNPEESRTLISNFLTGHIETVLNDCKRKGWDLNNIDIVFVGGGSKLFKREIRTLLPTATISQTAEWDNCEGFLVISQIMTK